MTEPAYPTTAHDYANQDEELERLDQAMRPGPIGAITVSGIAVGLLLLGWFFVYFFIFLPRGTVG